MRHATLGASGAKRWMNCPASIRLAEGLPPSPTNKYAAEGTVAHAVGEAAIRDGKEPKDYIGLYGNGENDIGLYKEPTGHEFEFQVTAKMARDVKVYTDAIREKVDEVRFRYGEEPIVTVEKSFGLHFIQLGMFGTNDCSIWVPGKYLGIFDYKNGRGLVEVEDNPQLKYYGLGALRELCWQGNKIIWTEDDRGNEFYHLEEADGSVSVRHPAENADHLVNYVQGSYEDLPEIVELCIVQPNASHINGPVRFFPTSAEHLVLEFADELRHCAVETGNPESETAIGDWCTWCVVETVCPARQKQTEDAMQMNFALVDISELNPPDVAPKTQKTTLIERGKKMAADQVLNRTPDEMGKIVAALPMIEAWCSAMASHAQTMAENGQKITGQKLVETSGGRRTWKAKDYVMERLSMVMDEDEYTEPKLKSFTEIEEMPGMASVVAALTNKPKKGLTLAPESDKRPAVVKSAAQAFSDVSIEDLI